MILQTVRNLFPYLISLGLCLWVAHHAWRRSNVIGARSYALTAIGQIIWMVGYICELLSPTLESKMLWDHTQWLGVILVAVAWFLFVLDFVGREIRHRARVWAA